MERPVPEGVFASLITPFHADGSVDWQGLDREVRLIDQAPVDGICVGGLSSGMAGALPDEIHAVCAAVRARTKKTLAAMVYPDIQLEAREMVDAVVESGANLVLVSQPHYLCQPAIEDLPDFFADLRRPCLIPIMLADCLAEAPLSSNSIRLLIEKAVIDGVVEGRDSHVLVDLLPLRHQAAIWCALEDLHFVGVLLGASAVLSEMAAVFPDEVSAVFHLLKEARYSQARAQHERLCRLWKVLSNPSERNQRFREALRFRGRSVGPPRSPFGGDTASLLVEVRTELEREGVLCNTSV